MECPHGEVSFRRSIRTAKSPYVEKTYGKMSYGEMSNGENSYGEKSGSRSAYYPMGALCLCQIQRKKILRAKNLLDVLIGRSPGRRLYQQLINRSQ